MKLISRKKIRSSRAGHQVLRGVPPFAFNAPLGQDHAQLNLFNWNTTLNKKLKVNWKYQFFI